MSTPVLTQAGAPTGVPASARRRPRVGPGLGLGLAVLYLSLIVLFPLTVVAWKGVEGGAGAFWSAVTTPDSWAALKLTLGASALVAVINVVMGTLIAWVLVRDRFPGKALVDTLIDLPFALPTIVAGLVLLVLYGVKSPLHLNLAYTRAGVVIALLFVTLPFVVRTVQPVLQELDRDMEQAAFSLGAGPWLTFRRIILPNLVPAMVSGAGLAFTRAIAEFGSTVLLSGNLPFKTQVAAVNIFGRIESDDTASAAAVSTALLIVAFAVLIGLDLVQRWGSRRG
ncbi:MAG: sulfate ABC transporter permease subunit CysT [Hamadaea sp.]|uniref:sulfate ABC transporter permease subunit CysT n=1 Tax=Hamadaea sp. TaxID=2024425 RepID=UPI00180860E1|nr:sulfate ABC transporter permease subunit CysT [Hamadaea sp.]NUR74376.1 sulfate ABC transporter permease subunit CysT [Hamadaea sp.]NUT21561.1 sulfate ABC transporter permease subunit CysT [Hamadaea sp.]